MSNFDCAAIPVKQTSVTFYVASVKVADLETICRPLARPVDAGLFGRETSEPVNLSDSQLNDLLSSLESRKFREHSFEILSEEREQPYQRFIDEKRAVEIARYLQQPTGMLPNSIILAVNVDLDESDVVCKGGKGEISISLPRSEHSAVILDGQHRVAAFRYLDEPSRKDYEVVVTFLVGIPFYQQAELFAIINGTQKRVNRSIIYDLFGYAPLKGDKEEQLYEGLMAVARFCSHVARILNSVDLSPWFNKIKMRGPGDEGIISQAAVVEYLSALVEPKTYTKRLRVLPLLYTYFKNSNPAGCAALLILYVRAIQTAQPVYWKTTTSLLWKNNGVAVILRILHDDLFLAGSVENFMNRFACYVERWKKAPYDDLAAPPKTGGGGIQNQVYDRCKTAMFNADELERLLKLRETADKKLFEIGALVQ